MQSCTRVSTVRDVTLRQLRFLAETVRAGSIAGAAAQLHVTAPAVAQQLHLLERSLGLPLVERGPGGQRATEAGQVVVDTCARIDAELMACDDTLHALRSLRTGRVAIGAVSTAKYFAPHLLAAFRESHPEVSVTIAIGNRGDVLARLEDYSIDLAIMGRPPRRLETEHAVFGEHAYVVIADPHHRLVGKPDISFDEIAAETFLIREAGSGTRQHLDTLFSAAGRQPSVGMEIPSNETIKQAVMAGLGVALISAHTIAAEVNDGRLAVLDVRGLPVRRHWLVVRMARRAVSPSTTALWDFVVERGAQLLPALPGDGGQNSARTPAATTAAPTTTTRNGARSTNATTA
jgi:LysR family transcriptional regulator, low CO2-responsive transcriptional regulator